MPSLKNAHKSHFFRKWSPLVVLSMALAIIIIDTTVLNVSLAEIIRDLGTTIQGIQWVITGYALTLAALTITGGRLGDLFGRKRMFMVGAVVFAIGSFLASISHSVGVMIAGEAIIEGMGAALMMPATASLLVSTYHGRDRAIGFGVWGGIAAASAAIGPILGGFLTKYYSWRWAFRINVFVALALLIGATLVLRESRDTEEKPSLDFLGVGLSVVGLLGLVYGMIESSTFGWWKATQSFAIFGHSFAPGGLSPVPFALVGGLLVLVAFVKWQLHQAKTGQTPLVSMGIFKNRQFTSGATTMAIQSLGMTGMIFVLPVFFRAVLGKDALATGISQLPMALAILVAAPLAGVLSQKIRPKLIIQTGLLLAPLGILVLRSELATGITAADLIPGLVIAGAGMGMVMSTVSNLTLSAVSVQQAGEASGVNNTMRQVGSTFGSAILGAILLSTLASNMTKGIDASAVIPQAAKPAIAAAASSQTSNVEFGGGARLGVELPDSLKSEIVQIGHQATVDAGKTALGYTAAFAFIAFLVSFALPNAKNVETEKSAAVTAGH